MKLSSKVVATGLVAGALVLGGNAIALAQTVIATYDNEPACRVGLAVYAVGHPGASLDCQRITISGGQIRYWLVQN
ncbi:hypothetical protein [Amycolatopsis sp. DSM 110486]|uniref:hypothetical protein n=1 Tax=Amycolatopsis sp. DSM 110486 TaxID=2865832 RepID=UPI001C69AD13|nr:hypothetical protein [Amycolatopsis sp. DSM 110486]QYN21739.1 hypothetical protein K1T34_04190 [Amycolatopsis sp. DSM 110486]